ncbi:unnamed protein product [Phaedon cochleariae]|uniref:Glycosyltransferase subfamily 4-like N-terminal domain-containing protein n=1 Tax=Phaedon cochleariae TaxID=80249 RepID=A0A9P0DU08_PHACE|nr:unnamed protein product [Phaedon cochleariae]
MEKLKESKNVAIVVLGDIGRSPRMQYHSLSLTEMGHKVDVFGYGETSPMIEVKEAPLIQYHYLVQCPVIPLKIINYAFKTVWQALTLLFLLLVNRRPDFLVLQNPPAIPAILICWVFCRAVGSKFIIDWHNYAHTIMALNHSSENILVKITKKVEIFVGKRADHNFCVTNAMKTDLYKQWGISAITLYDRPSNIFRSISVEEKHDFLIQLGKKYHQLVCTENSTLFTEKVNGKVFLKSSRPGVLVSSTSWTEDEDFTILLSALQDYEDHISNGNDRKLPKLVCFITGKGHLKDYYCKKVADSKWKNVTVITPWLESSEYPLILACADLGVSLHTSSSGLDLPMKVVDMFGCALPVCAYDFNCLHELVLHEKNGYTFKSSGELSKQLHNWFNNFPNDHNQQETELKFKEELKVFQRLGWRENWNNLAKPIFTQ